MDFTIGADPEFFLVSNIGELKSAIPVISGTKHDQLMVDGGGLQRDNVVAEFSCVPSYGEDAFVESIRRMIKQLADHVKPLKLWAKASADFPEKELEHPEAREFGCDPDFSAYTISMNEFSINTETCVLRSCGGHIHVGVRNGLPKVLADDEFGFGKIRLVKAMDLFIVIPSLVVDPDESAARRRELYGRAGCHRPKPYGVEYRTVGNFWTRSPSLVRLIYRLTEMSTCAADMDVDKEYLGEIGEKNVQRIIDSSDISSAEKIVDKYIFRHMKKETKELFESVKGKAMDIYKEWEL